MPLNKATEIFHYPGYVIRLHKKRQIKVKKIKICTKTMSQPIPETLSCSLRTLKKLLMHFFEIVTELSKTVTLWKAIQNLKRWTNMQKSRKICENS